MLVFQCNNCKSNGGFNSAIIDLVKDLHKRIDNLDAISSKIEISSQTTLKMKNIEEEVIPSIKNEILFENMHETQEFIRKSNNLIIHVLLDENDIKIKINKNCKKFYQILN